MTIDAVAAGSVPLSSISQPTNAEFGMQDQMSRAFDAAITKAVGSPSFDQTFAGHSGSMQNSLLPDRGGVNSYLREQNPNQAGSGPRSEQDAAANRQMEQVMEKFRNLHVEMTTFTVAWSVAKRTGRDVETLLKAQ